MEFDPKVIILLERMHFDVAEFTIKVTNAFEELRNLEEIEDLRTVMDIFIKYFTVKEMAFLFATQTEKLNMVYSFLEQYKLEARFQFWQSSASN